MAEDRRERSCIVDESDIGGALLVQAVVLDDGKKGGVLWVGFMRMIVGGLYI